MTEKEIIVALEFGSTSIRGIAGRRSPDGSICILDIESEKTADAVHKGVIYNIDKTTTAIQRIISNINAKLDTNVTRAYVGLSGQSLHTASNCVTRQLETKVKITTDIVDALKDNNSNTKYTDSEILDVVPQEYVIGQRKVTDPIGVQSEQIQARFMNIVAREVLQENIRKCMNAAGIAIADLFISPLALADNMLSENEKRSGCALVDMGSDTTTVSIYIENILRHLAVIPLGGANITYDIASVNQMDTDEAESIKCKYGVAYVASESDNPQSFNISNDRKLNENLLQNIISARQEEIIMNVWEQIKIYDSRLLSGIIVTGGASQMRDITAAYKHHTKNEKVKTAKSLVISAEVAPGVQSPQGVSIDTLIALLLHGTENCVTNIVVEEPESEVFAPETEVEGKTPDTEQEVKEEEKQKDDTPKGPGLFGKLMKTLGDLVTE